MSEITGDIIKLIVYIVFFVVMVAVIDSFILPIIGKLYPSAYSYEKYFDVLIALLFRYMIIRL